MGWTPQWYIFIMSGDFWVPLGRRNPKYFDEKDEDGRYWKTEGVSRRVEVAQDLHVDEVYEPTDIMIGMLHAGAYSEITVTVTPPNYYQPGSHGTENPINSTVHYNWDYLGTFDRTTPPFYGKRGIRKTN